MTKELSARVVRGPVLALAFKSDTSSLQLTFGGAALFSSARLNLAIRFMDSMFRLAGGQTFLVHDPLHSHLECRPRVRIPLALPSSPSIFGHLGESPEIRACARDLCLRMDPESGTGRAVHESATRGSGVNPLL